MIAVFFGFVIFDNISLSISSNEVDIHNKIRIKKV
jgi:hypothetical protein